MMLFSCKSKPINQKIDKKKEGLWVDNYQQDSTTYKSFEYYKNDQRVKNLQPNQKEKPKSKSIR